MQKNTMMRESIPETVVDRLYNTGKVCTFARENGGFVVSLDNGLVVVAGLATKYGRFTAAVEEPDEGFRPSYGRRYASFLKARKSLTEEALCRRLEALAALPSELETPIEDSDEDWYGRLAEELFI